MYKLMALFSQLQRGRAARAQIHTGFSLHASHSHRHRREPARGSRCGHPHTSPSRIHQRPAGRSHRRTCINHTAKVLCREHASRPQVAPLVDCQVPRCLVVAVPRCGAGTRHDKRPLSRREGGRPPGQPGGTCASVERRRGRLRRSPAPGGDNAQRLAAGPQVRRRRRPVGKRRSAAACRVPGGDAGPAAGPHVPPVRRCRLAAAESGDRRRRRIIL